MKTSLKTAIVAAVLGLGVLSTPAMAHDYGYGGGDRGYSSRDYGERDSHGDRGDHRRFERRGDRYQHGERCHNRHGDGDDRRCRERGERDDDSYGHGRRGWR